MPKYSEIEVVADFPLTDELKYKVCCLAHAQMLMDHYGRFRSRDGEGHDVAKIHFHDKPLEDGIVIPTSIYRFGGHTYPDGAYLYLETPEGEVFSWVDVEEACVSEYRDGLIFNDEDGKVWFEVFDTLNSIPDMSEPLRAVSIAQIGSFEDAHEFFEEDLPVSGSFRFSVEEIPVLVEIDFFLPPSYNEIQIGAARKRLAEQLSKNGAPCP